MITKEKAIQIIDEISIKDIIRNCFYENPESPYHTMDCFLNLNTGEVFYKVMGHNESFQKNDFVLLYSLPGRFRSEIPDSDIAGDDEIPDGGVEMFPDYDDRILECLFDYAIEGKDAKSEIYQRLDQIYFEQEYNA